MGEMKPQRRFHEALDELSERENWGCSEVGPSELEDVAVPRIETLVAGFSNKCHLRCPFCYESHFGRDLAKPQSLDLDKLIRLVNEHKQDTGQNIEYFRIGNTGEPLLNTGLDRLLVETNNAVNWYSVISSLSIRAERMLNLIEEHPKVNMIHVSCDSADADGYARIRPNGNFDLVWRNISRLKKAGKYLVLNAVAMQQNAASLKRLPRRMADYGIDELHIFYPLNTNADLNSNRLHKLELREFSDIYSTVREACERYQIVLRTDPWAYHPEMVGVIEDIDTPERYEEYRRYPCDWQWMLILHPDGSYHHCSVQNNLGLDAPVGERPFDTASSLLDLANSPEASAFRRLHLDGRFPLPCRTICHKQPGLRPQGTTRALFTLKYNDFKDDLTPVRFLHRLREQDSMLTIRAFSPAIKQAFESYPDLWERVQLVVDKNTKVTDRRPVVAPDNMDKASASRTLLIGSNRSSVFYHAAQSAEQFDSIYKVMVLGAGAGSIAFRQVK